jgi:hypothetical protein
MPYTLNIEAGTKLQLKNLKKLKIPYRKITFGEGYHSMIEFKTLREARLFLKNQSIKYNLPDSPNNVYKDTGYIDNLYYWIYNNNIFSKRKFFKDLIELATLKKQSEECRK